MLTNSDKNYIEDKLIQFRSDILNHVDTVLGELKAMREEFAILNDRSTNNQELGENHEEQLSKLESDQLTSAN